MKKIRLLYKIITILFFSFFVLIIGLYSFAYFAPKIELKNANQFYLYDNKQELVFQGSGTSKWINLEDISDNVKNAIVSIEDKRFFHHNGFDYVRICKAILTNFKNKTISEGASTISQQYIKNLFLDFDKTWSRKLEEAFLTLRLETHYSKEEILEGYLNTINFGQGNYGVENASNYYFNKSASELSLEEALLLAGIPKNPNNFNPVADYDLCVERAKIVAKTMYDNKYIDKNTLNSLFEKKINIYGKENKDNLQMIMYYQDAVIEELENIDSIPKSFLKSNGLKIFTNLDMEKQKILEKNILNSVNDDSNIQVAGMIINPKNGNIEALTGGLDYAKSQYNRAINAKRQVGSTIKPFLYYTALENNLTSSSTFLSEKTTFLFANNKSYSPANFNDRYANKNITMTAAIAYSDNVYAVKTHLFLGEDALVNTAKRAGIKALLNENPSLALGTCELSMLDYARGYTTLASGGYKRNISLIQKVEDNDGNVLYENKQDDVLALNENYVYILNEMLTSTYNPAFISYNNPTLINYKSLITKKYSIKTGSTGTDYWVIGYNPNQELLVWVGNDDNEDLNSNVSSKSKDIWVSIMEESLKEKDNTWYDIPENVVGVFQNPITGEIDNKGIIFYYLKGTEPK